VSADFDLEARITVDDQASGAFQSVGQAAEETRDALGGLSGAVSDGSQSWEDYRSGVNAAFRENRFINREFQVSNQLFFEGSRLIGSVGRSALRLTHIFTAYNTLQTNIGDAEDNLNEKREKAADALARYGSSSKKYQEAKKAELKAQQKLDKVNQGAIAQYVVMGVAVSSLAGDAFRVAKEFNSLNRTIGARGGIGSLLGLGAAAAPSLVSGISPLARAGIPTAEKGLATTIAAGGAGAAASKFSGLAKLFAPIIGLVTGAFIGTALHEQTPSFGFGKEIEASLNQTLAPVLNPLREAFGLEPLSAQQGSNIIVQGDLHVNTQGASPTEVIDAVNSYVRIGQRVTPPPT